MKINKSKIFCCYFCYHFIATNNYRWVGSKKILQIKSRITFSDESKSHESVDYIKTQISTTYNVYVLKVVEGGPFREISIL